MLADAQKNNSIIKSS